MNKRKTPQQRGRDAKSDELVGIIAEIIESFEPAKREQAKKSLHDLALRLARRSKGQ